MLSFNFLQNVHGAIPACLWSSSSMFMKLFQHVCEALPACSWNSSDMFMKLFQHVHESHPTCLWSSSSMFMKLFQHVHEALLLLPVCSSNQMNPCNCNHMPWPHNGMYSKSNYFQFNNCSQVTIRLGFSVTVPQIRLLSQTNFVPAFYFRILFPLPDNIAQHGSS